MIVFHLFNQRFNLLRQFNRNLKFFRSKTEPLKTGTKADIETVTENVTNTDVDISKTTSQSTISVRNFKNLPAYFPTRKIWVENLDTEETNRLGIINLHPEIFGARPRIDIIWQNIVWQRNYKYINYKCLPAKHEIQRSTRKPWPQKGTGRARHGTKRSPLFIGGVKTHGPRGPRTHFYMLQVLQRVHGLCSSLSIKLAQDDLHVVNNLEIPVNDPSYLLNLVETRKWGPSVLFVDVDDIMPENISIAADSIKHINLMPVYGLNCYSILKYTTLVLTLNAVERIEEKLLEQFYGPYVRNRKFRTSQV